METTTATGDVLSILILGLGWTGQFLTELLDATNVTHASTTRDGRQNTIAWTLPKDLDHSVDISILPRARTVVVTFPVLNADVMSSFITAYQTKYGPTQWILLSSTRPFTGPEKSNRHSPMDTSAERSAAEEVVLKNGGSVLHLAGLWGAQRQPCNWVSRFASTEKLRSKLLVRQLHLIHGKDVARAILAVHDKFKKGERWILTDGGCYDWIQLFLTWGSHEQIEMARKLAKEDTACYEALGNGTLEDIVQQGGVEPRLDSGEFWQTFGLQAEEFLAIK
ncbi:hypothetical protein EC973_002919 [Apophysomyces ossiformis]|uniref:Uncharacterized protein n=1 Tax=Apophysomyces ossiformis TaxID=679940 RepID=A0A8H7EQV6_9FUNG|nr:hypothetical protein EC973_002919 [Apophysomyces ossiformis]